MGEYYKNMSSKVMVTIELQEYEYLKEFYYKTKSKDVFLFDDWHKVICYTDQDEKIIDKFNREIRLKDDRIDCLKVHISELTNQTFIQKLKNLFK